MEYVLMLILGVVCGGLCAYFLLDVRRRQLDAQRHEQEKQVDELAIAEQDIQRRESELEQHTAQQAAKLKSWQEQEVERFKKRKEELEQKLLARRQELESAYQSAVDRFEERQQLELDAISDKQRRIDAQMSELQIGQGEFDKKVVLYTELQNENALVKRDLRNTLIKLRKSELDHDMQRESQEMIGQKVQEIGARYLKENVKWIGKTLNTNNFVACKQRLQDVIDRCRKIGFEIPTTDETTLIGDLRTEYEKAVRAAFEREEQARIRTQIREEQKREREIQRELERIDRERSLIQAALEKALAETHGQYSSEIEGLKARLAEAEDKQRAISQAQLTKAGYVYVISNIGSFGDGVFKVGMTRRLEPEDRIKELGDASVPFPFDIHMMISSDDAPALENAIHRALLKQQVNKTNPRKEFFKTDVEAIAAIVHKHHGEVEYVADAEALQYRQSLTMSDDDQEFIEHVFDELEEEDETFGDDPSQPVMSSD